MPVSRKVRWAIATIAGAFVLAALPAHANAADWQPIGKSCVSNGGAAGCTAASAFGGAWNVVVAPGGRHAYVAAWDAHAVHIFDRDPATGTLTHKAGSSGCWSEDGSAGVCTDGRGLGPSGGTAFDGPDGIAISPDGKFVYVASWSDSVAVFSRDENTGLLTQLAATAGCVADTNVDGCFDVRGLGAPTSLVMSGDGKQLYVGTSPIAVFDRDATTGVLTQKVGAAGCVSAPAADGCDGGTALAFGRQAALTPDGLNFYVPVSNGVAIFDRDPASGIIDQKVGTAGCVTSTGSGGACVAESKLGSGVLAVLPSPNGTHLYVSTGRGMLTFSRGAGGSLSLQSCITDPAVPGCATGENVAGLSYSAISPDGADLVATRDFGAGGMVFFARDPASGNLARRPGPDGCISANGNGTSTAGICRVYPAVGSDGHVAFVDDSSFVAGFYFGSAVGVFKRDFYPQCVGRSVAVPHNQSVAVPLACSDANGDALTLSIAQPPLSGSLGAIDVAQGRVFYNPFGGFSGADHFSYQATGAGLAGPPAEVSLSVASPPPPPPPPTPRIKSPVRVTWGVSGKRIFLLRLKITKVPKGGKAELRCGKAKKCPFKRKSSKKRRGGAITLFKEIKASQIAGKKQRAFRAGQRLELRITAPGFIGKVVRYELKKSKIPSGKELCLPLGAKKPRNSC